jgi:release factor glutamine methyltransferase
MGGDECTRLLARAAGHRLADRELRWILEDVAADPDLATSAEARTEAFDRLVARRAAGEPLQYVLGRWPFRSVELTVDRRVLIPRPETERVVEVALEALAAGPGEPLPGATGAVCVDLGTGSGAIALSLAVEAGPSRPGLEVWATDDSDAALEVATANLGTSAAAVRAAGARVHMAAGSWFDALPDHLAGRVDLVVSNPPYVAVSELVGLDPEVRLWEPIGALVAPDGAGGVGGMADVEAIVAGAPRWLRSGGALVVEIAPHQADAAVDAAGLAGLTGARVAPDLAGRPRALVARR